MPLLNIDTNAKTVKGQKKGYMTAVLYLAPANLSGYEVCPMRSSGCTAACLNTAGRGKMSNVQRARVARTIRYMEDRDAFLADLIGELKAFVTKAMKAGLTPAIRLNGTSDIPWERVAIKGKHVYGEGEEVVFPNLMSLFKTVQFYDYTKITKRAIQAGNGVRWPHNYHLTFSKSENNWDDCLTVLNEGGNVAAVFDSLPETYDNWTVIDGDADDLRFLPQGLASMQHKQVIVGLKAKGDAKHDTSGFVIRTKQMATA
jgi:hypothetical protein